MTDFFDRTYSRIQDTNAVLSKMRVYSLMRVVIRVLANILLPVYFMLTSKNPKHRISGTKKKKGRVIVSLTSFPARISRLWLVIETILRQTKKPDKIILWLSEEQYPSVESVPKRLKAMMERGLDIRICSGDIRSHKKYYYALKEYPEDILVTLDDDIVYNSHLLSVLLEKHGQCPEAIIAHYTHQMVFMADGSLAPYREWKRNVQPCNQQNNLFFGSGGGTLFPAHSMIDMVSDIDLAMSLTPAGDDIWLNAMARLKGTRVLHTNMYSEPLPILNLGNKTLFSFNSGGGNDSQIQNLQRYCEKNLQKNPFSPDVL